MSRIVVDLTAAVRSAGRSRFVPVLAVLGLGITTAVFSIFNGILLEPLPFPHPEQLVAVYDTRPAGGAASRRECASSTLTLGAGVRSAEASRYRLSLALRGRHETRQRRRHPEADAARRTAYGWIVIVT